MSTKHTCRCGAGCAYDWPVVFQRAEGFYPVVGARCEDWSVHAALNPGTVAIEDAITRERLWPEGTKQ